MKTQMHLHQALFKAYKLGILAERGDITRVTAGQKLKDLKEHLASGKEIGRI